MNTSMKKLILFIVFFLFVGCSGGCKLFYAQNVRQGPSDVRESIVKMTATVKTSFGQVGGFGTAWAIASDDKQSIFVTAGHVCVDGAEIENMLLLQGMQSDVIVEYKIDGFAAEIVLVDKPNDVCLIKVSKVFKPLQLSQSSPSFGDKIWYVGYPDEQEAVVDGKFVKRMSGKDAYTDATSMAVYGGASGSPVFNENGYVIGIVDLVDTKFSTNSWIIDLSILKRYYPVANKVLQEGQ